MPPPRSRPKNLAGYLSALSRPVFSAGMSWKVVDAKWDGITEAFADFDPKKVAAFGPDVVDKLMANEAVIRSRPKIEAVIENAQTMLDLERRYKGFRKYLHSFDGYDPLRRRSPQAVPLHRSQRRLHVPLHRRRGRPGALRLGARARNRPAATALARRFSSSTRKYQVSIEAFFATRRSTSRSRCFEPGSR